MKSGFSLDKGGHAMTFFNYDNYPYPPNSPSTPLYISVPPAARGLMRITFHEGGKSRR